MKNNKYIILILSILMLAGCTKDEDNKQRDFLIFPIGRSFQNSSVIDINIGEKKFDTVFVFDSCGGYWLQIPQSDITYNEILTISITRKKADLKLFSENDADKGKWISSSYYIDSDIEAIKIKATELTSGINTNIEKAKIIQQYVIQHITMKTYKDSFLDKASKTLSLGYGTCMNFSRLYVALCRAANVPARTIWGVVYGYNNDNIYDYHHQWAEILDDSGYWHPADFNYTTNFDLNDVRYLDLIYAAEENDIIKNRNLYEIMFKNLKYYNNYPVTLSANLGFRLISDSRPDSMIVKFDFKK